MVEIGVTGESVTGGVTGSVTGNAIGRVTGSMTAGTRAQQSVRHTPYLHALPLHLVPPHTHSHTQPRPAPRPPLFPALHSGHSHSPSGMLFDVSLMHRR